MAAKRRLLLIAPLLLVALSLLQAQEFGSAKRNDAISVAVFQRESVIGLLGQPLGSVVRVTGIAVDGSKTRQRADSGQTLLKIETVDGKQLANPVYFTFRRSADGIDKPDFGTPIDYFVHEWGSFDGVVQPSHELGIEMPVFAHDGFRYRSELTIHKSNRVRRGPTRHRK